MPEIARLHAEVREDFAKQRRDGPLEVLELRLRPLPEVLLELGEAHARVLRRPAELQLLRHHHLVKIVSKSCQNLVKS